MGTQVKEKQSRLIRETFKPVWWAWNTHVHTIVPSQFGKVEKPDVTRVEIDTPDGDFLEIDICEGESEKPVVALFHGLEGSSERYYIRNLMKVLKEKGMSSVALNFRGCGSRLNRKPRFYHSGETKDYRFFFEWVKERYPSQKLFAVGYSLGGNALIKYLGEEGLNSQVECAVAVSPPYDLKAGSINLHHGFNRVYELNFLKTLVEKLENKRREFPDLPSFNGNSVYEFDDRVTAPIHGFKDADDYYHQCSSMHFFEDVKTDLLIIHSKVDPLCPIQYAPLEKMENNPHITTCFTEEGGHVGFLSDPPGWTFRTISEWLEGRE